MKTILSQTLGLALLGCVAGNAQSPNYVNFIRQVQFPEALHYDVAVAPNGQEFSQLAINPGGARFELWTVSSNGPTSTLLSSTYVSTHVPVASVTILSEDQTAHMPRTRADRPFQVLVNVSGLLAAQDAPESSKSVTFLHHAQSYGAGGDGMDIDRSQAIMQKKSTITTNNQVDLRFSIHSVPSINLSKARGEERFSVFSLADDQAPESRIASETIQIWPVADGSIAGITNNQSIQFRMPQITLTMNDLYPNSTTYVQAYQGHPSLGTEGRVVPGTALVVNESIPQNRVLVVKNYDAVFDADGVWTIELLTSTPFGIDRLAYVSFSINRTLDIRGTFTTME